MAESRYRTDRFEQIYGAVTADLFHYLGEEHKQGRLTGAEGDWFTKGLIAGFLTRFEEWQTTPNEYVIRYLDMFSQPSVSSDLRLAAHVFLHISYDLPRVIADSFSAYPGLREPGRAVFIRPGPRFLKVFLQQMRRGTFGLAGRLVGRVESAKVLGYWMVALRSVAWIHAEALADADDGLRSMLEERMAAAMCEAGSDALEAGGWRGVLYMDNSRLTAATPFFALPPATPSQAAMSAAIGTAIAASLIAAMLARRRRRGASSIEALGALVHRGMARALTPELSVGGLPGLVKA